MAAGIDVEDIVRGYGENEFRVGGIRVPVERRVGHRKACGRRFVGSSVALRGDMLDLDAPVDLPARASEAREHAQRRNFGCISEMADLSADRVGGQFAAPIDSKRFAELGVSLDLKSVIISLRLAIFVHGQTVLDFAGGCLEDEVRELAVVDAALDADRSRRPMKAKFNAVALLKAKVRTADEKLSAAAVRPE